MHASNVCDCDLQKKTYVPVQSLIVSWFPMKKIIYALIFGLCMCATAQESPVLLSETSVSADWFAGFDNLGANYYVKDNTLFKQKEGKILQYKNISFGKIERVDLINPMSIAVFYKDFNAAVFLDNQLNEIRRINFSDFAEPLTVTALGNASQNRLWIYNSINQQIALFDYLKNSVRYLAQPLKGTIVHYESDFNYFHWLDDLGNRYSCDLFGKITAHGRFPAIANAQFVSDSAMLYLRDGQLYCFTLGAAAEQRIDLGKKSAAAFWYGAQNLAIFTTGGISLYKIKLR